MSLRVLFTRPGDPTPRRVPGPADLHDVGPGHLLTLAGTPDREADFGRWAGALGAAAIRGASLSWQ